jgi:2-dehydro-3-deoxyglucarate aldolase/4-hydroxy-2-oxoheptanedioate aldolase
MSFMPTPLIPPNELRQRLATGRLAVGTMIAELRQTAVMQGLAQAGLDWVIIDNEHGVFNPETIAELSRAAQRLGVTPIVRVPVVTYEQITHALDGGAQGIMIPRITGPEQVRLAVSAMKYPPEGQRGSALGRGHTGFRSGDVVSMMADSNRETFLVVQIETRPAVERLDEILSLPGVDAALIGPNDLAIALGVPGRMRDPALESAIEAMMAACARHQRYPGIHTNDVGLTAEWARRGMRLVSISSELGFLTTAAAAAVAAIRASPS